MNYGYHETLWLKWMERSAEKKRIEKQQALIKPFLKPGQLKLPLCLTNPK